VGETVVFRGHEVFFDSSTRSSPFQVLGSAVDRCGFLSAAARNAARGTAFNPLGRRLALVEDSMSELHTANSHGTTFPQPDVSVAFPYLISAFTRKEVQPPCQWCRKGGGFS